MLIDTNALLRFLQTNDKARPVVLRAVSHLQLAGEDIVIVPQNLYEFWVVATRPTRVNGFGWTAAECETRIAELKQVFDLLPDPPGLYDAWQRLVIAHDCKGQSRPRHPAGRGHATPRHRPHPHLQRGRFRPLPDGLGRRTGGGRTLTPPHVRLQIELADQRIETRR